jgi:hypothetical protein
MSATWQEALMMLHERGWNGELIDEACSALVESCSEGEFEGREVGGLTPSETGRVLKNQILDDESSALCQLAEVHDRADRDGDTMRAALRDLDAFADALGEQ